MQGPYRNPSSEITDCTTLPRSTQLPMKVQKKLFRGTLLRLLSRAPHVFRYMDVSSVAYCADAFGTIGDRISAEELLPFITRSLCDMNATQVAIVVRGFSQLNLVDCRLRNELLKSYCRASQHSLQSYADVLVGIALQCASASVSNRTVAQHFDLEVKDVTDERFERAARNAFDLAPFNICQQPLSPAVVVVLRLLPELAPSCTALFDDILKEFSAQLTSTMLLEICEAASGRISHSLAEAVRSQVFSGSLASLSGLPRATCALRYLMTLVQSDAGRTCGTVTAQLREDLVRTCPELRPAEVVQVLQYIAARHFYCDSIAVVFLRRVEQFVCDLHFAALASLLQSLGKFLGTSIPWDNTFLAPLTRRVLFISSAHIGVAAKVDVLLFCKGLCAVPWGKHHMSPPPHIGVTLETRLRTILTTNLLPEDFLLLLETSCLPGFHCLRFRLGKTLRSQRDRIPASVVLSLLPLVIRADIGEIVGALHAVEAAIDELSVGEIIGMLFEFDAVKVASVPWLSTAALKHRFQHAFVLHAQSMSAAQLVLFISGLVELGFEKDGDAESRFSAVFLQQGLQHLASASGCLTAILLEALTRNSSCSDRAWHSFLMRVASANFHPQDFFLSCKPAHYCMLLRACNRAPIDTELKCFLILLTSALSLQISSFSPSQLREVIVSLHQFSRLHSFNFLELMIVQARLQ